MLLGHLMEPAIINKIFFTFAFPAMRECRLWPIITKSILSVFNSLTEILKLISLIIIFLITPGNLDFENIEEQAEGIFGGR